MLRFAFNVAAMSLLIFAQNSWGQTSDSLPSSLKTHCAKCHGAGDNLEGELNLLAFKTREDFLAAPAVLQRVIEVLEDREMPPADQPQIPESDRLETLLTLKAWFAESAQQLPFNAIPMRRMNRFQYNNAVVDLLELDRDIFQLNERLLRRRSDYFNPASRSMPNEVRVSSRPLSKDIDNQRPEGFRGVAAFPQDQRAEHGFDNQADHLTLSPLLMESFLKLSESVAASPDLNPGECRSWARYFSEPDRSDRLEGESPGHVQLEDAAEGPLGKQILGKGSGRWSKDAHLFWQCPAVNRSLRFSVEIPSDIEGLHFRLTQAPDYGQFQLLIDDQPVGKPFDLYDPTITLTDVSYEGLTLEKGRHQISFRSTGKNTVSRGYFFGLDYLDLIPREVPSTTPTQSRDDNEIRSRIQHLVRRAFRRPADSDTVDELVHFSLAEMRNGATVEDTMRHVITAVLAMPQFLYLYEDQTPDSDSVEQIGRERITDFELATRLAQFFWSSIPDDPLLDLAERGELSQPDILGKQIDRMLDDRRAGRFCDNFPAQWLQLDRLITSIPDPEKFGYFYFDGYRTSMHMISEPLLLFETVFVEDRSVLDFIQPDFTWQSSMLEANYQGHNRGGREHQVQLFRRVALDDPRRGGVITNAAVLTMTSSPTRTQPITRGAWMNEVIFNDPPDPPPADVPPLPEPDAETRAKMTIRERLAAHRERADCASCHDQIDPLGFALENYGPTGVWRDEYDNGRKVDATGVLFREFPFQNVNEFKALIVDQRQRFYRAFAAHLLNYGLGRSLGPADARALNQVTQKAMSGEDSLRTMMKNIAMSEPFLRKNTLALTSRTEP